MPKKLHLLFGLLCVESWVRFPAILQLNVSSEVHVMWIYTSIHSGLGEGNVSPKTPLEPLQRAAGPKEKSLPAPECPAPATRFWSLLKAAQRRFGHNMGVCVCCVFVGDLSEMVALASIQKHQKKAAPPPKNKGPPPLAFMLSFKATKKGGAPPKKMGQPL